MDYRELVMHLLETRETVCCVENNIRSEFSDLDDPDAEFHTWCAENHLQVRRLNHSRMIEISKYMNKKEG